MKVSVIIPTYNRAHLIGDSIESVINQTYDDWELIIVDDGSTDDTLSVVNPYLTDSRITFHNRPLYKPKGANACRNHGLSLANGDYIKWLDSDDKLDKVCLELQLEYILEEKANVNICQSEFFKTGNEQLKYKSKKWGKIKSDNISNDLVFGNIKWTIAAGLWEKNLFKWHPFNENIQNSQEWLFHIETSMNPNLKYSFTEQTFIWVRAQEGSMSHRSNKTGVYYYYYTLAKFYAISCLYRHKFERKARIHLMKKFFRFQLFSLYKGSLKSFLQLIKLWPQIFYKTFL